jgi:hypothetical protein
MQLKQGQHNITVGMWQTISEDAEQHFLQQFAF